MSVHIPMPPLTSVTLTSLVQTKEDRDTRDNRDNRENRERREHREGREGREGRDDRDSREHRDTRDRDDRDDREVKEPRADWMCTCGCHNFARRSECFRCHLVRTADCISVVIDEAFPDNLVTSPLPCCTLCVRSPLLEKALSTMFRQFAPVKEVRVLKEGRQPKGFAYVLFHTAEHAQYALESWRALEGGGMGGYGEWGAGKARVAFAREDVMHQLLSQATPDPAPTAIAQWGAHTHNAQAHRHMHPNMHPGAGSPSTGIPGPGPGHPANYPQAYGHGPAPTSAYPLASAYASAHARRSHPHSFPPHFESQGGSYVFTPSTYFHHTATDYYHDPKSHLYYSGMLCIYYKVYRI
eukprot:CAMPEP_0173339512 /NCGR_PEP_ID=MMETSP1144-20121109/8411_1 /TAXON_ID=483371 /ORGANISM="non described non described, Strain CCMP2298" /LENGTH=353 /DNA_ID=CAMNT_0014285439 /DNA_START=992 /DNA_END=2056 /DNA_ORIENTATION=-